MSMSDLNKCNNILMTSLDDYNSINSENETLNDDEILYIQDEKNMNILQFNYLIPNTALRKKLKAY